MASLLIVSVAVAVVPPLHVSIPCFTIRKLFPSEENGQERIVVGSLVGPNKQQNKILPVVWTLRSLRLRLQTSITHQHL